MIRQALKLLENLGYTPSDDDNALLDTIIKKCEQIVSAECTIEAENFPQTLCDVVLDFAIARFLKAKLSFSPEDLPVLCREIVKQLSIGDTSVSYANNADYSAQKLIDMYADFLIANAKEVLKCYRRIHW